MASPQINTRYTQAVYEEILRLAKLNNTTPTDVVRKIVEEGLMMRAEKLTDSQFAMVEKRLSTIEERFAAWLIKLSRAAARNLFYTEQIALYEVDSNDQEQLREASKIYAREFLRKGGAENRED